jgi:hypothetical protein
MACELKTKKYYIFISVKPAFPIPSLSIPQVAKEHWWTTYQTTELSRVSSLCFDLILWIHEGMDGDALD